MNWQEIFVDIGRNNRKPKVLVGVHPSYGQQLVCDEKWEAYHAAFHNKWSSHGGPKILIPSNRNKDSYFAPYPNYETYEFPSGMSAFKASLVLVAGATAKNGFWRARGCVDDVLQGLKDGNFAKRAKIEKKATLYP